MSTKSAQRVILSPEMSFHEAYSHVITGAVPYEAFEEWDADRIKRIETRAKAAVAGPRELYCRVAAKGGVSLYGINSQMPVTLYAEQWERLIAYVLQIQAFLKENADALERKSDDEATKARKANHPARLEAAKRKAGFEAAKRKAA
jgi:hypothetical protein